MNIGIDLIAQNLLMSFETVVLLIMIIGSLVFFAKGFQIGITMMFVISGAVFSWFYYSGLNYAPMLVIFLLSLVVMTFSLYFVGKTSLAGGVV